MNLTKTFIMAAVCGSFIGSSCTSKTKKSEDSREKKDLVEQTAIDSLETLAQKADSLQEEIKNSAEKVDQLLNQIQ